MQIALGFVQVGLKEFYGKRTNNQLFILYTADGFSSDRR